MLGLRVRFVWPMMAVSLGLLALCALAAVSLVRQQATIAELLRESVASRRAATELDECLRDLVALLKDRVESVGALHERARVHLRDLRRRADQPDEIRLADRLDIGFANYLDRWQRFPPTGADGHAEAVGELAATLERDVLRDCQEFEEYNYRRIEQAAEFHERQLRRLAWGMAGVVGLSGITGLLLGYLVARGLRHQIRRLQVQVRDAAGKLSGDTSEIVVTDEGDLTGLHAAVELLTGRVETAVGALQQRERELQRADQLAATGQLAAGVAHEIRNPLASIKMLVQAGQEGGGLSNEDLDVIVGEVRRMERRLQTFLDYARPPKPERRPVDLHRVARAVLGLIRGRADQQGVAVELRGPVGGLTVVADGDQIQQVLVNTALNALDAMPSGGHLELELRPAPGGAEIAVTDSGPGFAPAILTRLFQPFVSGKDTGLGLGLLVCKRIIDDHGGRIEAGNRLGGGAAVIVYLPSAGVGEKA